MSVLTKRVPIRRRKGGLSTPSMTTSSWLSAPLPWPPPNMPGTTARAMVLIGPRRTTGRSASAICAPM